MSNEALLHYLKPLTPFLENDKVTEIVINYPNEVFVETWEGWECHKFSEGLEFKELRRIAGLVGTATKQDISEENPILSTSLASGERVQIVIPPAVPQNTVSITIRKPSKSTFSLEQFVEKDFFSKAVPKNIECPDCLGEYDKKLIQLYHTSEWLEFFDLAVKAKKNIIISGATGSGKTTFSKALIQRIPSEERIITIEDTQELEIPNKNHVRLFYSKDNQGISKAGAKELLESCLRMRPDRIMLQELRDEAAFFYLRNVNSGHPGSITTVHANSATLAFVQLGLLVKENKTGSGLQHSEIQQLLVSLIDIIVQIHKIPTEGRFATEIYFDPAAQYALAS